MGFPLASYRWLSAATATDQRRGVLAAGIGVLVLSFDALLVRLADASPWDITFWRGSLICLALLLLHAALGLRLPRLRDWRHAAAAGAGMIFLALNMLLFVLSVNETRVANTVVILTAAPLFAAVFSVVFLKERIELRTWVAILGGALGVIVVFASGAQLGTALGDLYAVILAVVAGATFTILRCFPSLPRMPLVCGAGAIAGLVSWPLAEPLSLEAHSYAALAVMGLLQMPTAMMLMATATRFLPSPEVSLYLLIETILGPIWVWIVVGEAVPRLTLLGGSLILMTVGGNAFIAMRSEKM